MRWVFFPLGLRHRASAHRLPPSTAKPSSRGCVEVTRDRGVVWRVLRSGRSGNQVTVMFGILQWCLGSVAAVATSLPGAPGTALLLWLLQVDLQLLLYNLKENKLHSENVLLAHKIPAASICFLLALLCGGTWCPKPWTWAMPCDVPGVSWVETEQSDTGEKMGKNWVYTPCKYCCASSRGETFP